VFFASIFDDFIVQPIFNLLVLIYGLVPGHNYGISVILFTIVTRLLLWPLLKKQLHHTREMRKLQPELKRIKKEAAGDRQKESLMQMELYKERGISPFGTIGILLIQITIFIGLYSGIRRIVDDPQTIVSFSYGFVSDLSWLKQLAADISQFDASLLGFIDLTRPALNPGGGIYYPALMLVLGSAVAQFFQSKQLLPKEKDARSLRTILKEASSGKQSDQTEVNAAVGQSTKWFLPIMIIFFTIGLASALSLYWLVSGLVAYIQQSVILKQDDDEMDVIAREPSSKEVIEGEVVESPNKKPKNRRRKGSKVSKKKQGSKNRRKR
jgi:YidC/Oxa1 family membrane protein insertase